MLSLINYPLFKVILIILLVLGLFAQVEGCSRLNSEGRFRVRSSNSILIPVSNYTSGQTCSVPLLYLGNILVQVIFSLIIIFLLKMDEDTLRKRGQLIKEPPIDKEEALDNLSNNLHRDVIGIFKIIIFVFAFMFLFSLCQKYIPQYMDPIALAVIVVLLIYFLFSDRNNPNLFIYQLFHPSKLIKLGYLVFILLFFVLYLFLVV